MASFILYLDLLQFRQALTTLTMQVDELERIKIGYYFSNLESEQANLQLILQKTSTIVRAEVDIYERIANKGLNDAILEPMSTQGPDPYCTYATTNESSSIFSILPPTPIIPTGAGAGGSSGSTGTNTPQPDPIISTFYGYHEVNPFSTARNQTGTRDRHLFGEASSVESKESMMHKAVTTVAAPVVVSGNTGAKAPAAAATGSVASTAAATITTTTAAAAETSAKDSAASTSTTTHLTSKDTSLERDSDTLATTADSKDPKKLLSDKDSKAQATVEEGKGTEKSSQTANSEININDNKESESANTVNEEKGVNMRKGQQHHRHREFTKQPEDSASSVASATTPAAIARGAVTAATAVSSPTSEQAISPIPSYSHRSRSGSRSNQLGSTPDSPPVRGMIHIAGDSELLNNRDFSFSYEPSELLGQRNNHHTYGRSAFDGMMEEDEGGFGTSATSSIGRRGASLLNHHRANRESSSAASSLGGTGPHPPIRSLSGGNGTVAGSGHLLHGLRHTSSDGQLSHSSSSNLSSYSTGSLHHRRSTGRIKISSSGDQYLMGGDDGLSPSALALGTSLDDPTSSFMSWRKSSSAGLMGLGGTGGEPFGGRGVFEDGMPAFFADEDAEERVDLGTGRRSVAGSLRGSSRPGSGCDQETVTIGGEQHQHQGGEANGTEIVSSSASIIQMADGSIKGVVF
ncbi:hypothetical protein FBU30_004099 [Linnemannia zychae]|nr:hypothetical protein FBU30_004099 [Linnemannia zychae]